jgi:hypothetical protein
MDSGPLVRPALPRPPRRSANTQTAHFQDLHAEDLEPVKEPAKGGLIPKRAVHNGLDWLVV